MPYYHTIEEVAKDFELHVKGDANTPQRFNTVYVLPKGTPPKKDFKGRVEFLVEDILNHRQGKYITDEMIIAGANFHDPEKPYKHYTE